MEVETLTVQEEGGRLDSYISKHTEFSRTIAKKLIQENKVLVNGKKCKEAYSVQKGEIITIQKEPPKETAIKPQNIQVPILYEDENMLVVNKPKGMVVHPANGNLEGTLVNAIMGMCKDSLSGIGGEIRPGIVHRLDKDTSGVLMIAKNDKTHIELSRQIKEHEVEKTYIALVKGCTKENEATINMPIGRSTQDRKKMAVRKEGKSAVTHFKVLKRFANYTLLEVKIETGRTHQIRVHLAYIGYPIVGDATYSSGKNPWNIQGQCLHAKSLQFKNPATGKEMYIEAPLPEYFSQIIEELERE